MKRNPDATCKTCPYFAPMEDSPNGNCQIGRPRTGFNGPWPFVYRERWCGEHPDFFVKDDDQCSE